MGMRNNLIFGGVNSANYGIYITGSGVYNAPERAVEKVVIPGRSGLLMIDQGRYENVSVEYPAFAFGKTRKEFREKISAFRNAIASQTGYQRREDSYHPDEYRMALYAEGLNVDVGPFGGSGRFTIKFDCKPQRFLKDGEHPLNRGNGEKIFNPTEHASSPLLMIKGHGDLSINGIYDINLSDALIGDVELSDTKMFTGMVQTVKFNKNQKLLNTGDSIRCAYITMRARIKPMTSNGYTNITLISVTDSNGRTNFSSHGYVYPSIFSDVPYILLTSQAWCYYANGADTQKTNTVTVTGTVSDGSQSQNFTVTFDITADYHSDYVRIFWTYSTPGSSGLYVNVGLNDETNVINPVIGTSTKSVLGDPTYIDCDLGECYQMIDGVPVSLNKYIALGSDLPQLQPGANTITYDGTITEVKVTPRWWKL